MAGHLDLPIDRHSTFVMPFRWRDAAGAYVDLDAYSAEFTVWQEHDPATILLSASSAGGEIVMTGTTGTLTVPAADVAALLDLSGLRYRLHLTRTVPGYEKTLLKGAVSDA